MLLGLIFRGVAFEFRFKATGKSRRIWDYAFHFGSLLAALMQGVIIGAIVQGIKVEGRSYAGGAFDWLDAYSVMTGVAVVFGYALLGGTWLVVKTDGETQAWARKSASYAIGFVAVFLAVVSISMPIMNPEIRSLWFSMPNFFLLLPIPAASLIMLIAIWRDLHTDREVWPYIVPFEITFRQAAAAPESQSLLLIGTVIMLPLILAYVGFCYYLFRGKVSHESLY
jgi:cytochrome d ubiquinol oxidase subunit II